MVLQGAPLPGAIFSMDSFTVDSVGRLAIFAVGSCFLVAQPGVERLVWDHTDLRDPNRAAAVFVAGGIERAEIGVLWIALLVMSLLVLSPFGPVTVGIAVMIAGLSALYSAPVSQLKGVPLVSSALHLAGGLLHFLLGYSVFSPVDARSLAVGCFFALTFSGGHLVHEVRDSKATNATASGPTR